jgi:hypothetical protein
MAARKSHPITSYRRLSGPIASVEAAEKATQKSRIAPIGRANCIKSVPPPRSGMPLSSVHSYRRVQGAPTGATRVILGRTEDRSWDERMRGRQRVSASRRFSSDSTPDNLQVGHPNARRVPRSVAALSRIRAGEAWPQTHATTAEPEWTYVGPFSSVFIGVHLWALAWETCPALERFGMRLRVQDSTALGTLRCRERSLANFMLPADKAPPGARSSPAK